MGNQLEMDIFSLENEVNSEFYINSDTYQHR